MRKLAVEETESLHDSLLDVVDEAARKVFKEAGAEVIYTYLENNYHLKREEITEKPDVFSTGLERLLTSEAPMIEILILKNSYSKLGLRFKEKEGYGFPDYVTELSRSAAVEKDV